MSLPDLLANGGGRVQILPEYVDGHEASVQRWRVGAILAFCLLYGFAFGSLAPVAMIAFTMPIVVLSLLCVWALPNLRVAPTQTLSRLLFAFMICLVTWPNYLAFAPPGLPWITMVRLTGFPLVFILLVCLSTSSDFRSEIGTALKATPAIWKLFVGFTILELLSVGLSLDKVTSFDKFIVAQISWTAIFFTSAYVFLKPGRVERMAGILWAMALFVGTIGIAEWKANRVLWADHIPGFLKIEDPSVLIILGGNLRSEGVYRAVSTFSSPLGLGEYAALTMPFVLQFLFGSYRWPIRVAAAFSVLFIMFVAYVSGTRLGQLGCLLAIVLFGGCWSVLKWRREPQSLLAPALIFSYPFLSLGGFAAIFLIGKLRNIFWGSGAEYYSTLARQGQFAMAIPKVLSHPLGYGMGMGGVALGFNPFGFLTIDSYYLSVVLEYGVVGFIIFYSIFLFAVFYAGRVVIFQKSLDRDEQFLLATSVSLLDFMVIKSSFSQEDNHAIVFMMLGIICALVCRVNGRRAWIPT